MENKYDNTWKMLVETAGAKHRHTVMTEIALQEELKRTTVWSRCCLCKGCVSAWFENDDCVYCQSCHKLRFDKCEACSGCLDWHTLRRNDTFCTECYDHQNKPY